MDGNEWSWWFNQTISQICSHMLLANGVRKLKLPRFLPLLTTIIIGLFLKLGCRKNSLISFLEMTNVCMNLKSPILRKKKKFVPSNSIYFTAYRSTQISSFCFSNQSCELPQIQYHSHAIFHKMFLQSSFSPSSTIFSWWNSVPNYDHFPALRPFVLHQRSLSTLGASSYSPCLLPPRAPAVHLWPRCLRTCTARGPRARGYLAIYVIYLWLGYPPML